MGFHAWAVRDGDVNPCRGNFDCDEDVDGTDAAVFKASFGRSPFKNPCSTCQDNPCPCPEACPESPCNIFNPFICQDLGGGGNCCCCIPVGNPDMNGMCKEIETCITLPPHPIWGPYDCF